jgi:hypothetical protein
MPPTAPVHDKQLVLLFPEPIFILFIFYIYFICILFINFLLVLYIITGVT